MKLATFLLLFGMLAMTAMAASPGPQTSPETTVNDFFTYLLKPKREIMKDKVAQDRWLTKDVRHTLATAVTASNKAAKAHPGEQIDAPDNGTFLAAWDPPTSFKVTEAKATPPTARVDVRFTWGPKTQYPGETRIMTTQLILEDGAWRIADIHAHAAKFNQESTLLDDLRKLAKQH